MPRSHHFSQGKRAVSDKLAKLELPGARPIGKTALRDAMAAAVDLLRPGEFGDAIYLITDGRDNASKLGLSEFKHDLLGSGTRVFALVLAEAVSRSRTPESEGGPDWLRGFADATGGDIVRLTLAVDENRIAGNTLGRPHPGKINKMTQRIIDAATVDFANEITGFYRVMVKLPEALSKPRDWDLKVLDGTGKLNNHWHVIYPQRLAACQ